MSCLRDYIGLRWCQNQTTPESGIWLNSFPGVTFKTLSSITNEEQDGIEDTWNDIKLRADLSFGTLFNGEMSKRYQILSPKKSYNLDKALTTTTYNAGTLTRSGFTVKMYRDYADYPDSLLSSIYCQSLGFYGDVSDVNDVATVQIWDLISGTVLFTYDLTVVQGWNLIPVNQFFHNDYSDNSTSLFVCINATGLKTTGKELSVNWEIYDNALVFTGATTTTTSNILSANITEGGNSYGLTGIFSSACTWDALLCNNKQHFMLSYAYNQIVEVMNEIQYTPRLNAVTINIGKEKAKEIRDYYLDERDKVLKQECDSIKLSLDDACLVCNQQYTLKESIP